MLTRGQWPIGLLFTWKTVLCETQALAKTMFIPERWRKRKQGIVISLWAKDSFSFVNIWNWPSHSGEDLKVVNIPVFSLCGYYLTWKILKYKIIYYKYLKYYLIHCFDNLQLLTICTLKQNIKNLADYQIYCKSYISLNFWLCLWS